MKHTSVLLNETIEGLNIKPQGIYVDGTLGRGGHAKLLISKLTTGHLYAFDQDEQALKESAVNLHDAMDKVTLIHDNFRHMKEDLQKYGIEKADGIMLDLGVSSPQFDDPERGFSYRFDARLDMRMDQNQTKDAYAVVNSYSIDDLTRIIRDYGEERYAYAIARAIDRQRRKKPIETTFELSDIIKSALPSHVLHQKGHPAKQTFQALRIEVNDEMGALEQGLREALDLLNINGRLAVITFQSLEDRMVKQIFRKYSASPYVEPKLPVKEEDIRKPSYRLVNRHPITADEQEIKDNHRAHSAKLRVIERTGI